MLLEIATTFLSRQDVTIISGTCYVLRTFYLCWHCFYSRVVTWPPVLCSMFYVLYLICQCCFCWGLILEYSDQFYGLCTMGHLSPTIAYKFNNSNNCISVLPVQSPDVLFSKFYTMFPPLRTFIFTWFLLLLCLYHPISLYIIEMPGLRHPNTPLSRHPGFSPDLVLLHLPLEQAPVWVLRFPAFFLFFVFFLSPPFSFLPFPLFLSPSMHLLDTTLSSFVLHYIEPWIDCKHAPLTAGGFNVPEKLSQILYHMHKKRVHLLF